MFRLYPGDITVYKNIIWDQLVSMRGPQTLITVNKVGKKKSLKVVKEDLGVKVDH